MIMNQSPTPLPPEILEAYKNLAPFREPESLPGGETCDASEISRRMKWMNERISWLEQQREIALRDAEHHEKESVRLAGELNAAKEQISDLMTAFSYKNLSAYKNAVMKGESESWRTQDKAYAKEGELEDIFHAARQRIEHGLTTGEVHENTQVILAEARRL